MPQHRFLIPPRPDGHQCLQDKYIRASCAEFGDPEVLVQVDVGGAVGPHSCWRRSEAAGLQWKIERLTACEDVVGQGRRRRQQRDTRGGVVGGFNERQSRVLTSNDASVTDL